MADERPAFQEPDWFARRVFNPAVTALTRLGVSLFGSRVLRVRGRRSGETQWVRNLRASGAGELRVGRRREPFTATEVTDEAGGVGTDSTEDELRAESRRHPIFRLERKESP